jgi:signal transduction histidine kinase
MTTSLTATLREARAALEGASTVEPGEAAVARRLMRELGEAILRLEGVEPEKDLVSIVCHDLKDPLASIVMGAGFLKKAIPKDESAARRVVEAISRSADRMNQVVGDFHDLAKLEGGLLLLDRSPCDAVATLRGAMSPLEAQARERGIELTLEASDEHVIAMCDRVRLVQIASKLVGNAIRFTDAGGKVVVRVAREAGRVRVSVSDTGRGIALDRLPAIFDRAVNARRSPRDGPGLGLAIARGLVELHGGDITVQSCVGEGSTFVFTLPGARG